MPSCRAKPLTDSQKTVAALIGSLPDDLRKLGSRSAIQIAIARHLDSIGIHVVSMQAQVGTPDISAGCEYLLVDGLRMDVGGRVGDREIIVNAFRKASTQAYTMRPPRSSRFDEVSTGLFPPWLKGDAENRAVMERVRAYIGSMELAKIGSMELAKRPAAKRSSVNARRRP